MHNCMECRYYSKVPIIERTYTEDSHTTGPHMTIQVYRPQGAWCWREPRFWPTGLTKQARLTKEFLPKLSQTPPYVQWQRWTITWTPRGNFPIIHFLDQPVVSASIAHWLKTTLEGAGIDTSIFKAHSTREASASSAALAADWSTKLVFQITSGRHLG